MKKIIKSISFFLVLICLLLGLSYLFLPKNNKKEFGMHDVKANAILGEKNQTIEVLIIGDSEAYSSISPMQIYHDKGFSSYVCATSGQYLFESVHYLEKALERQKPKVVIMETNAIFRKFTDLDKFKYELENMFSIFKYHDSWKHFNFNFLTKKVEYTYIDDYKGFYIRKDVVPADSKNHMRYTKNVKKIPKINLKRLDRINQICQKNQIKLLLLSTPSTINWNYKKHNAIKEYATETNIEYIDLNLLDIGIDWNNDSRDAGDHLNYFGAVKVTNFLTRYLDNLNILKDNRNDSRFQSWNESYKKYELEIKVK